VLKTHHRLLHRDSRDLSVLESGSIDLIVTSPPYPMIEMWDDTFARLNPSVGEALHDQDGYRAFELMHHELDRIWTELARVLRAGGIACINIGDATRSIGDTFRLYPNATRITTKFLELGFDILPKILWRKSTNSPNKFMGSGMLPVNAYVTLEHEYIIILRKGGNRAFSTEAQKTARYESSFFWEERNKWFSDIWDIGGVAQKMNHKELRDRSGAFPFEIPYRLINMYSVKGDVVLDPFLGTGTTSVAALTSGRNSAGVEIDEKLLALARSEMIDTLDKANTRISQRLADHAQFIEDYELHKGRPKYKNRIYGFPVITKQEIHLKLNSIKEIISRDSEEVVATYFDDPRQGYSPQCIQRELFAR
jgi:DNA modification methylase